MPVDELLEESAAPDVAFVPLFRFPYRCLVKAGQGEFADPISLHSGNCIHLLPIRSAPLRGKFRLKFVFTIGQDWHLLSSETIPSELLLTYPS